MKELILGLLVYQVLMGFESIKVPNLKANVLQRPKNPSVKGEGGDSLHRNTV